MMRTIRCLAAVLVLALGAGSQGNAADTPQKGEPIPFRVIPVENLSAFVKNWADESLPYYAIIGNIYEWRSVFSPAATMGNDKPFEPDPKIFDKEALLLVARISDAPPQGHKTLFVKSFELVNGEPVLSYGFFPPTQKATYKVKNTMLLAIPVKHLDGIRISEEIESAASMTAARELQEAKAAGRVKPQAQNR